MTGLRAAARTAHETLRALRHIPVMAGTGEVRDLAVAQLQKVLAGEGAARLVIGADGGEGVARRGAVEEDDGNADAGELLQLLPGEGRDGIHQDAIDALFHERLHVAQLLFRIEIAIAENQIVVRGVCRIFRAARHLREKWISNIADDQGQRVGAPCHQSARHAIGAVVQALGDGQDMLPRA